jgi:hypothetical protein
LIASALSRPRGAVVARPPLSVLALGRSRLLLLVVEDLLPRERVLTLALHEALLSRRWHLLVD